MGRIRFIPAVTVSDTVTRLFVSANKLLPPSYSSLISKAADGERDPLASCVLCRIRDNLTAAREMDIPICQDTGMAIVFAEVGEDVHIDGATLSDAVNAGVSRAYLDGKMRCSIVAEPLFDRKNTGDNTPAILHITTVPGDRLRVIAAPKGFGSENMSFLSMLNPSATPEDVENFVVESVRRAGSNPCPPIVVGVGVGSDFEGVALLAKRALLREAGERNSDERYARLEIDMLDRINKLGIGPQGFGGDTTALDVHIEYAPTHIAGLPLAVNINCHVLRHAEAII